jgi:HAD superfamily hydrolase (TIGR01509 family)
MLQGILFDMDGVLVDSELFICQAGIQMFKEKGLSVKESDFKPFTGMGENKYLGGVAKKYNFPFEVERDKARTYEIYKNLVSGKLKALNGVFTFIERCRQKNLKLAIASSADDVKVRINLHEIGLPTDWFGAIIHGNSVEKRKPHPDVFLKAAEELGVNPKNCLVIEDAVSGVEAAKTAGSKCLALATSFPKEKLHKADWISDDLGNAPMDCLNW